MRLFHLKSPEVMRNCLMEIQSLPLGKYQITIKEIVRNNQQNALYWVWADMIGRVKGFTKEEMHDAFKRHFLGEKEATNVFGQVVVIAKDSKSLSKQEFSEFMEKVQVYAASENITLPSPDYYGFDSKGRSKSSSDAARQEVVSGQSPATQLQESN